MIYCWLSNLYSLLASYLKRFSSSRYYAFFTLISLLEISSIFSSPTQNAQDPSLALLRKVPTSQLVGAYKAKIASNDWHEGSISIVKKGGEYPLRWTNKAGVSWGLRFDKKSGTLITGPGNPYKQHGGVHTHFKPILKKSREGNYLPEVAGFSFSGGEYLKYSDKVVYFFNEVTKAALDTYTKAEAQYKSGDYLGAQKSLQQLWSKYPAGTNQWHGSNGSPGNLYLGLPGAYAALRMLSVATNHKVKNQETPSKVVYLTFILPEKSKGLQPRTIQEAVKGQGVAVTKVLDPRIYKNNFHVIRDSIWLTAEYIQAITNGKLVLKLRFLHLKKITAKVKTQGTQIKGQSFMYTGIDESYKEIFGEINSKVRKKTDWYMIVYPSFVPEHRQEFKSTITGGLTGFEGKPLLILDDRWLLRAAPGFNNNLRTYTDLERRLVLSQWYQHELFHWFFVLYSELKLEQKGHDWFDRTTWPKDFSGIFETDYYHEAWAKRLSKASPPMHEALSLRGPGSEIFEKVTVEQLVGSYKVQSPQNDWDIGTISVNEGSDYPLKWTNKAGVSWGLRFDKKSGTLITGPGNPYKQHGGVHTHFELILKRKNDGTYSTEVAGFSFSRTRYLKEQ